MTAQLGVNSRVELSYNNVDADREQLTRDALRAATQDRDGYQLSRSGWTQANSTNTARAKWLKVFGGKFNNELLVAYQRIRDKRDQDVNTPLIRVQADRAGAYVAAGSDVFTPGNLLVLRLGDGSPLPSGNVAMALYLDEVTPAGGRVQTIPVPVADNGPHRSLTGSRVGESEGLLTRTDDGQYVFFTGYDAPPGTTNLSNRPSSEIPRIVARLDANAALDTTTTITEGYSPGAIRSAL